MCPGGSSAENKQMNIDGWYRCRLWVQLTGKVLMHRCVPQGVAVGAHMELRGIRKEEINPPMPDGR